MLERQEVWRAFSRAWAKTGKRIAARIAIMAITTSSSISVKPARRWQFGVLIVEPPVVILRRAIRTEWASIVCPPARSHDANKARLIFYPKRVFARYHLAS